MAFLFVLISFATQAQEITKDELLGRFDPSTHPDFIKVDTKYTSKSAIYLRLEAYEAYQRMYAAALTEGIELPIVSATRNFNYQKGIWERKWKRTRYMGWQNIEKAQDILTYSSMPGSSRHHWGTDIDLCQLNNDWFASAEGAKVYAWLCANAESFGFHQVYTSKVSGRTGYNEEKWHWSYLPLASAYLAAYNELIDSEDFSGFSGAELVDSLMIVPNYVNGVSEE